MAQKNSNSLVRKLLFANQDKKQLFFAFFGVLIGFVFISVSIHYLIQLNRMDKSSEIMSSNTITIQKKVSTSSTLSISNHTFSTPEINFYKSLPFIENVVAVENNNFPVELRSNDPLVPYFRSDIYIQSIPSDFLDVKSSLWNWKKGNNGVPIILPRDFVYMMNNFLSSSGMPQLSDEILKDVSFQIQLVDDENKLFYDANIIGFTNEISSILVPENFMKFGCQVYGEENEITHTQLMLKSKKGQFGLVEELIKRNHLEVKKNQMVEGKLKSMLTILLSSISFISLVVVFVSLIVLIQYLQLLITKNAYEIRTLLRIGVYIREIVYQYIKYILVGLLIVVFFISILDYILFTQINLILKSAGFIFQNASYLNVFILLSILFISVFISSIISVNKFVRREF
jgi:hypothetical protein